MKEPTEAEHERVGQRLRWLFAHPEQADDDELRMLIFLAAGLLREGPLIEEARTFAADLLEGKLSRPPPLSWWHGLLARLRC